MKRNLLSLIFSFYMLLAQTVVYAGSGNLFNVTTTGTPGSLSFTLCLNAAAQLSCQNYTVSALSLSITTAINHTYPQAGIKITTPGYTPTGCTMLGNGLCSFSVSNTAAASVTAQSSSSPVFTAVGQNTSTSAPLLVASTDGGVSWSVNSTYVAPASAVFNGASCTGTGSSTICVAAGQDTTGAQPPFFVVSTNGGVSWSVKAPTVPIATVGFYNAASCTGSGSSAICVVAGRYGAPSSDPLLVVSTDGGVTWVTKAITSTDGYFSSASCTGSGSTAVCVAAGRYDAGGTLLAVSTDGGVNWVLKTITGFPGGSYNFTSTSCTGSGSSAVCMVAGQDLSNSNPFVAVSSNGGVDWSAKTITGLATTGYFSAANCTGTICIAAGRDDGGDTSLLAVSSSSGLLWSVNTTYTNPGSAYFRGASCTGSGITAVCTAVGKNNVSAGPLLIVSTNGGSNWTVNTSYTAPSVGILYATSCNGSGSSAICTAAGKNESSGAPFLIVSSNGGVTWALNTSYVVPANGIFNSTGASTG